MAELKVKISSDVSEVTQGMTAVQAMAERLQTEIKKLNDVIGNTTSPRKLEAALVALKDKESQYAKIASFTADKQGQLASVTNQATTTMTNFTRVIQDAPFGIRGIANNIDPLVESFGRLKDKTGSAGGAFAAMTRTLAGRAGLLLAVSTVTSILVKFGDQIFSSGEKASESADKFSEATKKIQELQKELSKGPQFVTTQAEANTAGEISQINALVSVISNQTLSYKQRNNALIELQNINKAYFGDLSLEKTSLENLKKAVDEYSQALVAAEVIKIYKQRLAESAVAAADAKDAQIELTAQINKETEERKELIKVRDSEADAENKQNVAYRRAAQGISVKDAAIAKLNDKFKEQQEVVNKAEINQKKYNDRLTEAIRIASQFKPLREPPPAPEIKPEKGLDFSRLLKKLPAEYPEEFKDKLDKSASDSGKDAGRIYGREFAEAAKKQTIQNIGGIGVQGTVTLINEEDARKERARMYQLGLDTAEAFNRGMEQMISNSFISIGEGIGEAFTGGNLQDAFSGFAMAIGSGLEAIGKQLVSIGTAALLAKEALKTLFTNPYAAIAAGVALVAAGSAMQNALSQGLNARALGGPVSGGNPYLVGERGPELFVPSVSGSIVPNNSVGSFMSGRMGDSGRGSVLRGQDILLAYARTQRSQLRVNG